jgi:hypothetical protein
MSLKAFHLIFVTALSSLWFGCGIWKLRDYSATHGSSALALGIGALALGVATLVYGKYFLKKLKKFSYL